MMSHVALFIKIPPTTMASMPRMLMSQMAVSLISFISVT